MEKLETINDYLRDNWGIDTESTWPIFRVVFSDEQTEKRLTSHTDSGVELLHPEVRELPKYPWIESAYVLERLVIVPEMNMKELPATKKSYEPIWVFIDQRGFPVAPTIRACAMICDCLYAALGKSNLAKYKDKYSDASPQEAYELKKKEIDELHNELFGNESGLLGDTVDASGSTIIMPSNYSKGVH